MWRPARRSRGRCRSVRCTPARPAHEPTGLREDRNVGLLARRRPQADEVREVGVGVVLDRDPALRLELLERFSEAVRLGPAEGAHDGHDLVLVDLGVVHGGSAALASATSSDGIGVLKTARKHRRGQRCTTSQCDGASPRCHHHSSTSSSGWSPEQHRPRPPRAPCPRDHWETRLRHLVPGVRGRGTGDVPACHARPAHRPSQRIHISRVSRATRWMSVPRRTMNP